MTRLLSLLFPLLVFSSCSYEPEREISDEFRLRRMAHSLEENREENVTRVKEAAADCHKMEIRVLDQETDKYKSEAITVSEKDREKLCRILRGISYTYNPVYTWPTLTAPRGSVHLTLTNGQGKEACLSNNSYGGQEADCRFPLEFKTDGERQEFKRLVEKYVRKLKKEQLGSPF